MPPRPPLVLVPVLLLSGCVLVDLLLEPDVPNPFEGQDSAELELQCRGASNEALAAALERRLDLLDLDHQWSAEGEGLLRFTIDDTAYTQALGKILTATPGLGFYAVAEDQAALRPRHEPPEEAVLAPLPTKGVRHDLAFDVEAMQAMLAMAGARLPPVEGVRIAERFEDHGVYAAPTGADWQPWLQTLSLPEGTAAVFECFRDSHQDEELCSPWLVESPPPVTATDIVDVEIALDEQLYDPHLELTFNESGREAFHQLSTRLVDRYLAIVSEGRVLSRPRVMEPIPGGRAWLTLGQSSDENLIELWHFYVALQAGPLPGPCRVLPEMASP